MTLPRPPALPAEGWGLATLRFNGREISVVHDLTFDDPIPAHLAAYPLEPPIDLMLTLLRPGATFVDVGAHLGTFSLLAAASGARVAAIEANPRQAGMLAASAARNGFTDLLTVHAAASDGPGPLAFGSWGPWGHVKKETEDETLPLAEVAAVTVDDVVDELGWSRVDLVKLDIEGWEPRALRGMRRLLARDDGPLVIFESNAPALAWYGSTTRELAAVFEAAGYRRYLIDRLRSRVLLPLAAGDFQVEAIADYLAVKGSRPTVGAWTVARPPSRRDVVGRAVAWSRQHEVHRRHVASVLRTAEPSLLTQPAIRRTLARLRRDPAPEVRRLAGWSPPSPAWRSLVDRGLDAVNGLGRTARRLLWGAGRRLRAWWSRRGISEL